MHRIFSGDGWLVFPDILKSANDHRPSQRLGAAASRPDYHCASCASMFFYSPSRLMTEGASGQRPPRRQAGVSHRGSGWPSEKCRPDTPHLFIDTSLAGARVVHAQHAVPCRLTGPSFPAMLQPTALEAGTAWAGPKQMQSAAASFDSGSRRRPRLRERFVQDRDAPRSRVGLLP